MKHLLTLRKNIIKNYLKELKYVKFENQIFNILL